MPRKTAHPAFTLIELLVVVSILGLLIAILLPALASAFTPVRMTICLSNLRQTTSALITYSTDHRGQLMHYAQKAQDNSGMQWWFGFEAGGPGGGTHRPLDKSRGPLAQYLGDNIQDGLACPEFPDDDPGFVPKFNQRSAHFGYNGGIVPPFPVGATPHSIEDAAQASEVFAFVDAVHQDFSASIFYEPHTVSYRKSGYVTGAAHFRHNGRANIAMLDGHAQPIDPPPGESFWATFGDADVINVDTADGPGTRYGFKTWSSQ